MKLSEYLEQDVKKLTGIDVNCKDLSAASQILKTALLVEAYYKKGQLDSSQVAKLSLLFEGILKLLLQDKDVNKEAELFFQAVEKMIFPPQMYRNKDQKRKPFVPIVESLVSSYHSSPELVRAYEFRKLMSELSFVIEPICNCSKPKNVFELLDSSAKKKKSKKTAKSADATSPFCECDELRFDSQIQLGSRAYKENPLYKEAKEAMSFFYADKKINFTWDGLAKKIYLERLSQTDSESKLAERALNRSIQKLSQFEKQFPDVVERSIRLPVLQGEDLLYQFLTY